jgi:hypothetical protein
MRQEREIFRKKMAAIRNAEGLARGASGNAALSGATANLHTF